jgi:hypothetical protein
MTSRLSHAAQLTRFGMTYEEGHALRDRVLLARAADAELAQAVWKGMLAELRQQPADRPHPEAVRLRMLQNLEKGWTPGEAAEAAMRFARGEEA